MRAKRSPPAVSPPARRNLRAITRRLADFFATGDAPVTRLMVLQRNQPFKVLISALLSARTRDQVTLPVATALLDVAPDPAALRALSPAELESIIRPCGFYRDKAKHLLALARRLPETFHDRVPDRLEDLLTLPGIGRKTANLVLSIGYGQAAISVDIHVHRISNRLGLVATRRPEQTEQALRRVLPRRVWTLWNPWLVALGQRLCLPRRPRCHECPVEAYCAKTLVPIQQPGAAS